MSGGGSIEYGPALASGGAGARRRVLLVVDHLRQLGAQPGHGNLCRAEGLDLLRPGLALHHSVALHLDLAPHLHLARAVDVDRPRRCPQRPHGQLVQVFQRCVDGVAASPGEQEDARPAVRDDASPGLGLVLVLGSSPSACAPRPRALRSSSTSCGGNTMGRGGSRRSGTTPSVVGLSLSHCLRSPRWSPLQWAWKHLKPPGLPRPILAVLLSSLWSSPCGHTVKYHPSSLGRTDVISPRRLSSANTGSAVGGAPAAALHVQDPKGRLHLLRLDAPALAHTARELVEFGVVTTGTSATRVLHGVASPQL